MPSIFYMYGPDFLMFYTGLCLAVIFVCLFAKRCNDNSKRLTVPEVPRTIPVYEVAYLRGGENEVIRTAMFSLLQKELLQLSDQKVLYTNEKIGKHRVNDIETLVYTFVNEKNVKEIFKDSELRKEVKKSMLSVKKRDEEQHLLLNDRQFHKLKNIRFFGFAIIVLMALAKIFVAINTGHFNITFLVILLGVFSILLHLTMPSSRLSDLGRKYIENIQTIIKYEKEQISNGIVNDRASLMVMGVFGMSALSGHATYGAYGNAFAGCGGGCGGGGCGGGGCGGGCGGCGGCGG